MPSPKEEDPTIIVVYKHRRLQDVKDETLKVIDTCSQIKVIQQSWKTSMSGWWQRAQFVWIWTEHELSRILTSWWHHQWANFFWQVRRIFFDIIIITIVLIIIVTLKWFSRSLADLKEPPEQLVLQVEPGRSCISVSVSVYISFYFIIITPSGLWQ